ncbi:CDP-diacylglycerol--glycerol-3-phosphate 3-phosphatidyltransferase [Treponema bryantii]|uniref:CDP-diacylglycerol--glycerol-3-phosphate 3-phosphatidyltransferase n=1 Tax=Treponema bryantii TaxID=163 RepID=A0A1H9DCQ0_9SPIR|nr:CDP-alcohol phosphatidyltransferase family protein [Treponema bryantii]SEQ10613.1 CDP-diacylglycerol--glycerol-3-phosphate 3-phosphatidyltransferase [Treponema bryantii]
MANIITGSRILFSIATLFFPTFSPAFYALYLAAGITDMIDGTVARRTGKASEFGARLDSIADIVFVVVCLIKLIPVVSIPVWLYVWIGIIALIRIINIVSGYIMQKRFIMLHTIMNKVTGLLLFVLSLTVRFVDLKYTAIPVCAVATFAAIQEGHFIRMNRF